MDPKRAARLLSRDTYLRNGLVDDMINADPRPTRDAYLRGGLVDEMADQMAPSMYDITESPRYPMGELPLQTMKDMRQAQLGLEAIRSGRIQNLRNANPFQGVARQSIMDADEAHRAAMMGDDGRDGIAAAAALLAVGGMGGMAGQTVSDHRRGLNVSRDLERQGARDAFVSPSYPRDMTNLNGRGDLAALVNEYRPVPMSTPRVAADNEDDSFARAYIERLMQQRFMK